MGESYKKRLVVNGDRMEASMGRDKIRPNESTTRESRDDHVMIWYSILLQQNTSFSHTSFQGIIFSSTFHFFWLNYLRSRQIRHYD